LCVKKLSFISNEKKEHAGSLSCGKDFKLQVDIDSLGKAYLFIEKELKKDCGRRALTNASCFLTSLLPLSFIYIERRE